MKLRMPFVILILVVSILNMFSSTVHAQHWVHEKGNNWHRGRIVDHNEKLILVIGREGDTTLVEKDRIKEISIDEQFVPLPIKLSEAESNQPYSVLNQVPLVEGEHLVRFLLDSLRFDSEEILKILKVWTAESFVSPEDVEILSFDNKLILRGNTLLGQSYSPFFSTARMKYDITFDIKDSRFRTTISNIEYSYRSTQINIDQDLADLYNQPTKQPVRNKDKNKRLEYMVENLNRICQDIIHHFQQYENDGLQDNW